MSGFKAPDPGIYLVRQPDGRSPQAQHPLTNELYFAGARIINPRAMR